MEEILKYRSALYGFLALWIIIFHIESTVGLPLNIPVLSPLIQSGNICVDVFFFFSGYCCCLSYKRKPKLLYFYKRRFVRIVLPYLILAIPFYLWKAFTHYQDLPFRKQLLLFSLDLSGLSLWTNEVLTTWFVTTIVLFYLLFPIVFYISARTKRFITSSLVIAVAYIIGMLLLQSFFPGIYRKGCIAFTRFPIFCIGSLCAYYSLLPKPNKAVCFFSFAFIIILLGFFPVRFFLDSIHAGREWYWLIYILFTIPLVYSIFALLKVLPSWITVFLAFCGVMSLELYIVHILIRNVLVWYNTTQFLEYWLYLLLPLISIPVAYCVSALSNRIRHAFPID